MIFWDILDYIIILVYCGLFFGQANFHIDHILGRISQYTNTLMIFPHSFPYGGFLRHGGTPSHPSRSTMT